MNIAVQSQFVPNSHLEQLREGRSILRAEADALRELSRELDVGFCTAVDAIVQCRGRVLVTGVGKAGLIGRKISATLASTGTRSHFLHPTEAVHGDLGCIDDDDILLALSNSGETEEVCRLVPIVGRRGVTVVAIAASEASTLGAAADIVVQMGKHREAGPNALAPSTSTTVMLALGDALALVVSRIKGFSPQDFAVIHPGGSLGAQLQTAADIMRRDDEIRIASESASVREIFVQFRRPGRRSGAVMLTDSSGQLTGLFTDSDLARLLEQRRDSQFDCPISEVMTRDPWTIAAETRMAAVVEFLSHRKVSELPVVDSAGCPVGLIDITDILGNELTVQTTETNGDDYRQHD